MAIALMFQDSSVLYIDAVPSFLKSKSSTIASNPLDNRTVVADHVSKSNPVFTIKGVISSADFQRASTRSLDLLSEYGSQIPSEFNSEVSEVSIGGDSLLSRLFSNSIIESLFHQDTPDVTMDSFRGYSHELARDKLNSVYEACEPVTILDYDYDFHIGRSVSVRLYDNCLIRDFGDNEDPTTGDSFQFDLTFEQVRFAYLEQVEVTTSEKTAKKSNKGIVTKDTQGSNKAVSNSKKKNTWESSQKARTESLVSIFTGG